MTLRRVTFILPSISRKGGGVSEAARILAHVLAQDPTLQLRIITLLDEAFEEDRREWPSVQITAHRSFGLKKFGFSPGMLRDLLRSRSDIVHVHGLWMFHGLATLMWSERRSGAYIVTPHGMLETWIRARSKLAKMLVSLTFQDRLLRRAAAIQVLTEKERADIGSVADDRKVVVVPNFVARTSATDRPPSWLDGEMRGRRIFLFFGRIHEKKGWSDLLTAWDRLCERDPAFSRSAALVFAGWIDGDSAFIDNVARQHETRGNVWFVGPQYGADKQSTLQSAYCFVLPSKSEGLPMAVLEAWAAGVPVIMTKACNLQRGFEFGAALETEANAESLAEALETASRWTPQVRQTMADAGRALVAQEFSSEVVGARMRNLYEAAMGRHTEARPRS